MWGWPFTNDLPGRLKSNRWAGELLKGWACWVLSWTEVVIYPSETEFCYRSSSSAPWWNMRTPPGGSLRAHMSGGCRCYNPSVFALLRMPFGTLVTGRFTRICVFFFRLPHHIPNWEFRLKISWRGEPRSSATRQIFTLADGRPRRSKCDPRATGASRRVEATASPWPSRPNEACSAVICQALFGCPDWGFTLIFLSCKVNARA